MPSTSHRSRNLHLPRLSPFPPPMLPSPAPASAPPLRSTPSDLPPHSAPPFLSDSRLSHIPSLDIDYGVVDADDPTLLLGPVSSFALFGFSRDVKNDPRYRALAKFRRVTEQHGIAKIQITDFLCALRIHAAMIDRNAKKALVRERRPRLPLDKSSHATLGKVLKRPRGRPYAASETLSNPPIDSSDDIFDIESTSPSRWSMPEAATFVKDAPERPFPSVPRSQLQKDDRKHRAPVMWNRARTCLPAYFPSRNTAPTPSAPIALPPAPREVKPQHVQLVYHMLRHAESVYGFPVSMPSAPHVVLTRVTDRAIICRRTGIASEDLHTAGSSNTSFFPSHYVAVDRQIKAVVVCVRGTANLVDSLTDFAATQDPIRIRRLEQGGEDDVVQGFGHSGVLRSARNLFHKIRESVLKTLRENPGFELMTTGHSLGGATASVLAMIMRDDPEFPRALAFAFAPLPCLTYDLAELTSSFTVTVINGPDIVPRLSVAMLLPYFATARYVANLSRSRKLLIGLGFKGSVVDWDKLGAHNATIVRELEKVHEGCRLYIPGKVFQLVRKNEVRRADAARNRLFRRREVEVVPVSRTEFVQVRSRERGMLVSHAPFTYKGSLALALRSMHAEPLRKMTGGSVFRNLLTVPATPFIGMRKARTKPQESLDDLLERIGEDLPLGESA